MNLSDYADRRARAAGRSILPAVLPFMGSLDALRRRRGPAELVSFANYDYLGLARDPAICAAASDAVLTHGAGVSASRMIGGERDFHAAFEADLADFLAVEATLTLVSGYLTNVTLVGHVLGSRDLVLSDALSHNSIIAGIAGARATSLVFNHNDLDHLESLLRAERGQYGRCLIVVEGLYSMDGDMPDLRRLLALKSEHDAWLMVDEAHSVGVAGPTGRGIAEHFGRDANGIDLLVGTLSKALGGCGGFIGGRARVIEWLRYSLPGFVFSVGMAPANAASSHTALAVMRREPWRVQRLQENSGLFLQRARAAGLDVGDAAGIGVVPVIFADNAATIHAAESLLREGIYCPPVVQVGVPRNRPRLRFFLSACHEAADITRAVDILAGCARAVVGRPQTLVASSI